MISDVLPPRLGERRRWDSPMSCPFGLARSGKVKTSSSAPIVTFVIIGESSAASTTVYGFLPLVMVSPHGSQVVSVPVTFGLITARPEVLAGVVRHDVSLPAASRLGECAAGEGRVTHR